MEYPSLQDICEKYFMMSSAKELFDSVSNQSTVGFITDTHFYSKLWCLLSQFYISLIALILHFFTVVSVYMILSPSSGTE